MMTEEVDRKLNSRSIISLITYIDNRDVEVMSRMIIEREQREENIKKANKMLMSDILDDRKEKIQNRLKYKLKRSKSLEPRK